MTAEQLDEVDVDEAAAGPGAEGSAVEPEEASVDEGAAPPAAASVDESVVPPQYGIGPFSIREVSVTGVWLVAFVVSFFSLSPIRFESVWTAGLTWILTIAVPTVAVFLLVLRRLSPEGIRRVGSLGIDQFASVAFSVSAALWITYAWETVAYVSNGGPWIRSWVMWVELVLMLAGVALTVFAPIIPVLREDFRHRDEVVAHTNARPLRAVSPRPESPRAAIERELKAAEAEAPAPDAAPTAAAQTYTPDYAAYPAPVRAEPAYDEPRYDDSRYDTSVFAERSYAEPSFAEPSFAERSYPEPLHAASAPARHQAFWALAPDERVVLDESGAPLFRIGPTAWALVLEDRGDVFVMRDDDGRVGYLHDVLGLTRG